MMNSPESIVWRNFRSGLLNEQIDKYIKFSDFSIEASVEKNHCQVKKPWNFNPADISFMTIVFGFLFMCIFATLNHLLTKLEDLRQFQLPATAHKVMKCFSLVCNLKKLGKKTSDEDGLECIHGMKAISMFLIIMGHRIMFQIGSPVTNSPYIEDFYKNVEATVMLNGPIIVDTFFNISAFLATYLMLLEFNKRQKGVNIFMIYLHRFLRITPAYGIVLFFYCTLFVQIGSGPLWNDRVGVEQERCLASWWANLSYFNNYFNTEKLCMFQSWYVTCDIHLFLITPLLVWLLWKKPRIGILTTSGLLFISILLVFIKVFITNEDGVLLLYIKMLRDPVLNNQFRSVYIPTHLRASPYFVGILTGYLKYRMKMSDYKMPKAVVYMGWIFCVFIMEATVYSAFIFYLPKLPKDPLFAALYSSMHHFTWSLCISWMIIAISSGYGSWITPVISWRPLALINRITYSAFLCHGAIQLYTAAIMRVPYYMSIFNLLSLTASDIVLSYLAGLMLSQTFEAPIIGLEKLLFTGGGRKPAERKRHLDFPQNGEIFIPKVTIMKNEERY